MLRNTIGCFILMALMASCVSTPTQNEATAAAFVPLRATPCINGSVPTSCIFGIYNVQYIVQSAFTYESNILPSHQPVGDYDYMTPEFQNTVIVPGGWWNTYRLVGVINVIGSGIVAQFCRKTGGCFDYLHLEYVAIHGHRLSAVTSHTPPPVFAQGDHRSGDEHTAMVAEKEMTHAPRAWNIVVHGGEAVGRSRWPDWSVYGNGSWGPADAHLCVLMDQTSLAFFWTVATGRNHPPPFPKKRWGPLRARDRNGTLIWPAAWTFTHRLTWMYPYKDHAQWFGPAKGRPVGYMVYHFAYHRQLDCWPRYGTCRRA